jgi:hypothetical protein
LCLQNMESLEKGVVLEKLQSGQVHWDEKKRKQKGQWGKGKWEEGNKYEVTGEKH